MKEPEFFAVKVDGRAVRCSILHEDRAAREVTIVYRMSDGGARTLGVDSGSIRPWTHDVPIVIPPPAKVDCTPPADPESWPGEVTISRVTISGPMNSGRWRIEIKGEAGRVVANLTDEQFALALGGRACIPCELVKGFKLGE